MPGDGGKQLAARAATAGGVGREHPSREWGWDFVPSVVEPWGVRAGE